MGKLGKMKLKKVNLEMVFFGIQSWKINTPENRFA